MCELHSTVLSYKYCVIFVKSGSPPMKWYLMDYEGKDCGKSQLNDLCDQLVA